MQHLHHRPQLSANQRRRNPLRPRSAKAFDLATDLTTHVARYDLIRATVMNEPAVDEPDYRRTVGPQSGDGHLWQGRGTTRPALASQWRCPARDLPARTVGHREVDAIGRTLSGSA